MLTVPIVVQVTPSADLEAVKVLAERLSLSHIGTPPVEPTLALVPPTAERDCSAVPFVGVTNTLACFEFAASVSRTITPDLAQAFVLVRPVTLAMISVLPLTC
jgi:hypothetical protein